MNFVNTAEGNPEPDTTPRVTTRSKRVADTALDKLRFYPSPGRIENSMSATKRSEMVKARRLHMDESADIARVDAELKRFFTESFGTELTLVSASRITSRDEGFRVQLYWYAYHTVPRMTIPDYNQFYDMMMDSSGDENPQDCIVRLERGFHGF